MFEKKFWDWAFSLLLTYLTKYLTPEKLQEWADFCWAVIVPYARMKVDELVEAMRKLAAKTSTPFDDAVVDKLAEFLDAFMPDSRTVLRKNVPKS